MGRPYCIGIAGGKSTLCDRLAGRFGAIPVKTFHMDAYFRPEDARPRAKGYITGREYMDDNHPDTMDIAELRADMRREIAEKSCPLLIVEGLLVLQDEELCEMLDLKLFVDCDGEERMARRLKRNMQWGLSFDEVADVYLDLVRFRHVQYVEPSKWKADFILNGSGISETALDALVGYVRGKIE